MLTKKNDSADKAIRDIRRATRRQYSAEEKIRIVLEGLRGESSIAASLMRTFGRFEESIDLARKSIALDPVWSAAYTNLGYSCYYALRYEEVATAFRKALSLNPERPRTHYYLGRVLLAQGKPQAALAEMWKEPIAVYQATGLAMVYHALENREASRQALAVLIENWGETGTFQIAEVYAFLGENDAAFQWLQKAYDNYDFGLAVLLGNPVFAKLTSDARYALFVEKFGLLPYWQEMNRQKPRL